MAIDLQQLKDEISKSGTNKGKFIYIKEGVKIRVRFLTEFNEGLTVKFHDSYKKSINIPCQEIYGRECTGCDDEELRTRNQYVWSAYDYEADSVKLFMFPVNNCSPVGALAAFYEAYGTIKDRDYEIKKVGSGTNTTYSVVPLNQTKFRNTKVKAMSEQAILKAIDKAYPCDGADYDDDDDEEEEEDRKKKTKKRSGKKPYMNEPEEAEEEEWPDDDEPDYSSMKASELYKLCLKKDIDCEKRMTKQYYIDLLQEEEWPDDEED